MIIVLNEEESKAHIEQKIREAILEQTSRFPVKTELPNGCKLRSRPLKADQKATIWEMFADGMKPKDIARELGLPGRQVSGIIQGHLHPIGANVQAALDRESAKMHAGLHQGAKIDDLQPTKPLIMPVVEGPANETTCAVFDLDIPESTVETAAAYLKDVLGESAPKPISCEACGKPLDHNRVAIGGKFYHKACAPKKVPTMITRRPKPVKSNSAIDSLIVDIQGGMHEDIQRRT